MLWLAEKKQQQRSFKYSQKELSHLKYQELLVLYFPVRH